MTRDVLAGATVLCLALWGALFGYQYLWAVARLRGRGEGPQAQLILFRHAVSLLLLLMVAGGTVLVWRGGEAGGLLARTARPVLLGVALLGWWRQFRQWPPILGLDVAGTRSIPFGYWLMLLVAGGVLAYRYGLPSVPPDLVTEARAALAGTATTAWVEWLGACLAAAGLLVMILRADERLRWLTGNFRWHHPRMARRIATGGLALGMAAASLTAALVLILGLNVLLFRQGRPMLPDFRPPFPALHFEVALLLVPAAALALALIAIRRPAYDLFVSYKSEDVAVVRRVADLLIASGLRVWFAEYQVLLRRGRFEAALRSGLRRSRWGLAFTNDRYVESAWCRREIETLLHRVGPGRVLEVQLPRESQPWRQYPALSRGPSVETREPARILEFVTEQTGLRTTAREADRGDGPEWWDGHYLGRPLALDIAGWAVEHPPLDGEIGGLTFRHAGPRRLLVNLWAHVEESDPGRRQQQTIDDRTMFNFLVKFARGHLRRLPVAGVRATGVHLFFHSALSQIALSYRVRHYWTRKVSLVIPNPSTGRVAEFEFTFGFSGPFTEYCRHAALMDRLAQSLRWT